VWMDTEVEALEDAWQQEYTGREPRP
jgi:hypothetical protein